MMEAHPRWISNDQIKPSRSCDIREVSGERERECSSAAQISFALCGVSDLEAHTDETQTRITIWRMPFVEQIFRAQYQKHFLSLRRQAGSLTLKQLDRRIPLRAIHRASERSLPGTCRSHVTVAQTRKLVSAHGSRCV